MWTNLNENVFMRMYIYYEFACFAQRAVKKIEEAVMSDVRSIHGYILAQFAQEPAVVVTVE